MVVPDLNRPRSKRKKKVWMQRSARRVSTWRLTGCTMHLVHGPGASLTPASVGASTSNLNFEGRQGRGGLYHLKALSWPRRPRFLATLPMSAGGHSTWFLRRQRRVSSMKPFRKHTGVVAPLDRENVDTDQIIPKQFLKPI